MEIRTQASGGMRLVVLFVGVIVLSGCAGEEQQQTITTTQASPVAMDAPIGSIYQTVSPAIFDEKIQSGEYTVLDVRTQEEYDTGRITEDAMLVDFYAPNFEAQIKSLDKNVKYLLYCRSGNRSGKTLSLLEELGFREVLELKGGISNWSASYPVVQ